MNIKLFEQMERVDGFKVSLFSANAIFPTPVKTLTNAKKSLAYSYTNKTLIIREERHVSNTITAFAKELEDFIMLSKVLDGALVIFNSEEELSIYIALLEDNGFDDFDNKTSIGIGDYAVIKNNKLLKTKLGDYEGEIFTVGQIFNCLEDTIPF